MEISSREAIKMRGLVYDRIYSLEKMMDEAGLKLIEAQITEDSESVIEIENYIQKLEEERKELMKIGNKLNKMALKF